MNDIKNNNEEYINVMHEITNFNSNRLLVYIFDVLVRANESHNINEIINKIELPQFNIQVDVIFDFMTMQRTGRVWLQGKLNKDNKGNDK
jgi:hypothetical protein